MYIGSFRNKSGIIIKQENNNKIFSSLVKADMKSYKSLETAAIFYSSEPFLKQGIS